MRTLIQDLHYALRQMRKSPGFVLIAVLTLALGIGANTAVFSVMNAVLLRQMPVRDPERLYYVQIGHGQMQPPGTSETGDPAITFSEPVFESLRQRQDIFEDLIAYVPLAFDKVVVRYGEIPEEASGYEVSGNFFSGLTAQVARGRGFTLADERQHAPVAVISDGYWNRRFGRSPEVLGRTLFVKGVPFTIIGITAPHFYGVGGRTATDFWIPLQTRPRLNAWGIPAAFNTLYGTPKWWCLMLMARLRQNVTRVEAQSALQSTFLEAAKIGIGNIDRKQWQPWLDFDPAQGIQGYNQYYRDQVHILMGLVILVLLLASTNVALLLVARNEARQREFSLKMAVGARKQNVFRQLLTESSLLVMAGTALGWLFAILATTALARWSEIESGLEPDRTVLLFTLATSVLVAFAFGLAPLASALRAPISGVLKANRAGATQGRKRVIGGRILMSSQVAVCLLLLVAAGLLVHTLHKYQTEDLGMEASGLVVFGVTPQHAQTVPETYGFYRALLDRMRALPGVRSATLVESRPGTGWSDNNGFGLDGVYPLEKDGSHALLRTNDVGPDFLATFGIPILEGRDISDADTGTAPPVAIVNETFRRRFLGNTSPLGHKLFEGTPGGRTIVGVAKDSKYTTAMEEPTAMAYYPVLERVRPGEALQLEVRPAGKPLALLASIAKAVHDVDPDVALQKPTTQEEEFESSYAQPTMFARLAGFFGALAVLLVATGLYGTLAYRTNRRTTEIGMRMALGARRREVLWLIMRESLLISAMGMMVGLPLAMTCSRFLDSMLYELSPLDPLSFVLAVCAIALVGTAAAFFPAWRAAKLDPMVALRYE